MRNREASPPDAVPIYIPEADYTSLQKVVASHPAFDTVDDYVRFIVNVALSAETPVLNDSEVEDLTRQLAALGYV